MNILKKIKLSIQISPKNKIYTLIPDLSGIFLDILSRADYNFSYQF